MTVSSRRHRRKFRRPTGKPKRRPRRNNEDCGAIQILFRRIFRNLAKANEQQTIASNWIKAHRKSADSSSRPAPPIASKSPLSPDDVRVNTKSGRYWKPGSTYYGKTKRGEFMSEKDSCRSFCGYRRVPDFLYSRGSRPGKALARLGNYRRLARDYEINPRTSEAAEAFSRTAHSRSTSRIRRDIPPPVGSFPTRLCTGATHCPGLVYPASYVAIWQNPHTAQVGALEDSRVPGEKPRAMTRLD
jgi:hypothetical protein